MTWKPRGCFDGSQSNHIQPQVRLSKKQKRAKSAKDRVRKLKALDYSEYLQSRHWKSTRKQAHQHYCGKCNRCGSTINLQVHHKNYERIGLERMSDLELLCRGCHENEHEGEKFGVADPMTREFIERMK